MDNKNENNGQKPSAGARIRKTLLKAVERFDGMLEGGAKHLSGVLQRREATFAEENAAIDAAHPRAAPRALAWFAASAVVYLVAFCFIAGPPGFTLGAFWLSMGLSAMTAGTYISARQGPPANDPLHQFIPFKRTASKFGSRMFWRVSLALLLVTAIFVVLELGGRAVVALHG
jgi:hypothetical protein